MPLHKSAIPCRCHRSRRQQFRMVGGHGVAEKHIVLPVHVERIKVELIYVPMPICSDAIKAAIPLPRAWNRIPIVSQEVCRRLAEIAINTGLLPSKPASLKSFVKIGIQVIRVTRW